MQIYQDIWINGEVKRQGIRGCDAERYKPIQELCRTYKRPFTVLDIGACLGYFSFRLSGEFNCVSVMIEGSGDYMKALSGPAREYPIISGLIRQQKCKKKLLLLYKRMNLDALIRLSECEHFDVVLGLRVVHHFKKPFAQVIDAMAALGDHLFLELPTHKEPNVRAHGRVVAELSNHAALLAKHEYKQVGSFPIHVGPSKSPMYLIEGTNNRITRPYYDSPRRIRHTVQSNSRHKHLVKREKHAGRGELKTRWIPGINLRTWHKLNGMFPNRKAVSALVRTCRLPKKSPLTDISMWNFIIGGERVTLIDHTSVNDSRGKAFPRSNPRNRLAAVASQLRRK